ncbi:nuclear transport factor 2 family protein [Vallitalea guaymasensis]|uniref:Nuclear transport factor 2 family protein n=1 Tax=Vallitalea guaymasensis TaxID=1185412 RepID=A0A8J8MCA9_9FIRM|nr:nuclear transport factor 2 family protein [Vallitalea guaymasensis]QUH30060.1 nuclear transport factor 2 family protein [Vallitalea guaymasensis]
MTSQSLINNETIMQVKSVLQKFQKGYTDKDIDNIDSYMNDLFIKDDKIITIGTSRSEWCIGLEECKGLIESDWKYWGDLVINYENAKINSEGNTAWFLTDCTISWDSEDDFDEWCEDLVADYFEEKGRYINYNQFSKMAMLNLKLALIIKSSQGNKGKNIPFPIRLSGTLIKTNDKWLINKLHFSVPMSRYPEWRVDNDNIDSLKYYNQIVQRMSKLSKEHNNQSCESIRELLNTLKENYLNKKLDILDTVKDLFAAYEDIYIVDPNEIPVAIGIEDIQKMIQIQREKWDDMELNIKEAVTNIEGDTANIITNGMFKKCSTLDQLLQKEWNNIKKTLQKEGKGEDKLFQAQKQIAYVLKELSFGKESMWEFRFDAMAVKENDTWRFHNIQFTYPSLYVLEGNYDMIPLLNHNVDEQ